MLLLTFFGRTAHICGYSFETGHLWMLRIFLTRQLTPCHDPPQQLTEPFKKVTDLAKLLKEAQKRWLQRCCFYWVVSEVPSSFLSSLVCVIAFLTFSMLLMKYVCVSMAAFTPVLTCLSALAAPHTLFFANMAALRASHK